MDEWLCVWRKSLSGEPGSFFWGKFFFQVLYVKYVSLFKSALVFILGPFFVFIFESVSVSKKTKKKKTALCCQCLSLSYNSVCFFESGLVFIVESVFAFILEQRLPLFFFESVFCLLFQTKCFVFTGIFCLLWNTC